MSRWTVQMGSDDSIVIERTGAGLVAISIPSRREVIGTREQIEDLRRKLGAVIADEGAE